MPSILIATLGESPIVISGMVNVLRDQKGISLDTVQIIYPDEPNERWIGVGYELLYRYFTDQGLRVEPVALTFADAHTEEHSLEFLQVLNGLLETHEHLGNDVYLSLAGGRKHISALMAMLTQFYPCVKALYHLHDKQEHNPRKQYTIEFLEKNPDRLNQPVSRFTLIHLPCQQVTNGVALRRWLTQREQGDEPSPIAISPEAESFYGMLFQSRRIGSSKLELWLTRTAYEQYDKKYKSSLQDIERYFKDMIDPEWLSTPDYGIHNHADDSHDANTQKGSGKRLIHYACKKGGTAVRPFYYTQPHPIRAYPDALVDQVVITRFSEKAKGNTLDVELSKWVQSDPLDILPYCKVTDLLNQQINQEKQAIVLIAPLGESSMVVTQAYTLLQSPQHIARPVKVQAIHIVYPDEFEPARNGAAMLRAVCDKRTIELYPHPLPIADLDSDETIRKFISGLTQAITDARRQHPNADCALLISGGRKGMSAVAFYVAQATGITRVYHTTINDPDKDEKIRNITAYDTIKSKPTTEQAELLLLDQFNPLDFALITVPIIPFSAAP